MKVYRGKIKESTKKRLKDNKGLLKHLIGLGSHGLGRTLPKTYSIKETVEKYNPGLSKQDIIAWVWYRKTKGIPMKAWKEYDKDLSETEKLKYVQDGHLYYDPIEKGLVPYAVFAFGNLYQKSSMLEKQKEEIIKNYGESNFHYHNQVLDDLKPNPLSIQNPIESERPIILAISKFAREFEVKSLRADSGIILAQPETLQDAFKQWLEDQDESNFKGTNAYEIKSYYLNGERKPRTVDKIEWGAIKKNSRDNGERLFKKFLHEALETVDQLKLDAHYNSKFNSTAPLQHQYIPIGLEVSRKFMGFDLDIRPAQREGIAFMELVGSGIIAYDVGVGKTITAIIEVASAIKNGKCKRPLIVVPNPTYKNWIKEMIGEGDLQGILSGTGITINQWYNLGSEYDGLNLQKMVPENSVTIVTYEGLNKIGFNEYTQEKHLSQLSNILAQRSEKSARAEAKENENFREIIGVGLKETVADIEDLGIDYVVIDEAHNYKNVFSEVKSDSENAKQFNIRGGKPSNRAIKAFFLCNYIQRKYGRNVMLLTATPFTNSPLEIYSMLSLVAHEYMTKNSILNIREFFEQYIQETSEYVVGIDGKITQKDVVKSFNNRISLQKLINSHINFKTGEEANIPRPCKINLPKTTVQTDKGMTKLDKDDQLLTYLKMTPEQESNQRLINSLASQGASKDDPGRLLKLMSQSLNNALSPFLYSGTPANYIDFVENSPKILYTMECIRSVKQWHEKRGQEPSGQVIYMDRGKQFFPYVKEYLEKELGYKKSVSTKFNSRVKVDEVEVITGGMNASKKEKIKDAFNEGTCKIIIGTSTIKEGINLQKKSTALYNLYPNWNPTDIRQLEGRIWRQKNEFAFVRIVMPLMENSMDVFVFQKLDEKTSRINDLWSKSDRGNVLDEESLDPNEVKFALVTDLNVLVDFEYKQIEKELRSQFTVLKKQLDDITDYESTKKAYESSKQRIIERTLYAFNEIDNTSISERINEYYTFRQVPSLDLSTLSQQTLKKIERIERIKAQLNEVTQGNYEDKVIITAYSAYKRLSNPYSSYDWDFDRYKDSVSKLGKIERSLFKSRGYDRTTNLEKIRLEITTDKQNIEKELEEIKTEEFKQKLWESIRDKKNAMSIKGGSLDDRVNDFASLNHLLSYPFSKEVSGSCSLPSKENPEKPKIVKIDKNKKLRLARAKAKAIKLKLQLLAA